MVLKDLHLDAKPLDNYNGAGTFGEIIYYTLREMKKSIFVYFIHMRAKDKLKQNILDKGISVCKIIFPDKPISSFIYDDIEDLCFPQFRGGSYEILE